MIDRGWLESLGSEPNDDGLDGDDDDDVETGIVNCLIILQKKNSHFCKFRIRTQIP